MARAVHSALASGKLRLLLEIPITLRKPFNITGLATSWGCPEFRHFVPSEDDPIVSRLKAAGAAAAALLTRADHYVLKSKLSGGSFMSNYDAIIIGTGQA